MVTGESGKARDDVLAALSRRGWAGRLVWAFTPVQDRHAAPAIVRALGDLAAVGDVDVVIVARGGGSLSDLLCFCEESVCRTVALLGVPVIASVGHHTDRTLLDDVAAVSCSTPTHAAEAAVQIDCRRARTQQAASAARLRDHSRRAVLGRARQLALLSRAPGAHLDRQRNRLHQQLREIRAGARRRLTEEARLGERRAVVLRARSPPLCSTCESAARASSSGWRWRCPATTRSARSSAATCSRAPARASPSCDARAARSARALELRFADGTVPARVRAMSAERQPGESPAAAR